MNITPDEQKLRLVAAVSTQNRLTMPFVTTVSISSVDILAWLMSRPETRKFYWSDREGQIEIGGVGAAVRPRKEDVAWGNDHASMASAFRADDALLFPSYCIFDTRRQFDPAWEAFASDDRDIPEAMIVRHDVRYSFYHCALVSPGADVAAVKVGIEQVPVPDGRHIADPTALFTMHPKRIRSYPDDGGWRANVTGVLRDIDAGRVKKVVLARRTDYAFEDTIDTWSLFLTLRNDNPDSYAIYHQVRPGAAFMSFTPERLYRRDGRTIALDALSSTVPRGGTPDEDGRLESQLRKDDKQNREHQFVVDGVSARLNTLCRERPRIGGTTVMKLTRIQHLWTPIMGVLKDDIADDAVLDALHPTPATGGTPRQEAMEIIRRREPFDRGLYAAPWGYSGRTEAEYAVAIRSALVVDTVVSVFTGAGVVAGSDPDQEWRELDSKDILRPLIADGSNL